MAATSRSTLRTGYGYQPVDGHSRRYDAPTTSRTVSRYDAPSQRSSRIDGPASRVTTYRAPSATIGTTYGAPAARRGPETGA